MKILLLLSGWLVAAWLLVAPRVEPISLSFTAPESGPAPVKKSPIAQAFEEWAAEPTLDGALLGFCVLDEDGGTMYASPLADTALCPASALKTVTTAAAFDLLGEDFRFETRIGGSAALGPNGILEGNLILVGGGDPTLSSEDLEAMVAELVKAGLKQVGGRVLVDDSIFPRQPVSDHWNWGDIGNAYGAGAFGLNVDHNRMEIRFDPGAKIGDGATLLPGALATKDTRWLNRVGTAAAGTGDQVVVYSQPFGRMITLQGTVPLGEAGFSVTGALPDPPAMAAEYLTNSLQKAGVRILGREIAGAKATTTTLASHRSAPLPEIIDHLHKVSDNLEAQCLFLTMGRQQKADPVKALRDYWQQKGVFFTGLRLIDGSGLARATMIRPIDLAKINHIARHGSHGERYRQSLSTYLNGSVRAKLGAMSGVKTEVGFLTLADGREVTYALMANGLDPAANYWPLREQLLQAIK